MTAFKMQCRRTARDTEQCKSLYPVILSSIFQGLKLLLEYPSMDYVIAMLMNMCVTADVQVVWFFAIHQ